MRYLKKTLTLMLAILICFSFVILPASANDGTLEVIGSPVVNCKSAVLMEASTGQILYEMNADEALPPASVTKIMTLLLIMEAIEDGKLRYDDVITASEHACSMGGSQIYLKEGEQMSAEDMIKSVVIASANDAAVALAEHIYGSEEAFVVRMNERAAELGMKNSNFENTNGLDDTVTAHVTSARDIAIMSRELIKYEKITEFSSIWMDTIRNGEFGLTNTNRLVRFYKGATGLKTGSTEKAGFCISATAERDGMTLIAVIMGSQTRDIRNASAVSMLDWGFSNFSIYDSPQIELEKIKVVGGVKADCALQCGSFRTVVDRSVKGKIEYTVELPETLSAPIKAGDKVGSVKYTANGEDVASVDIIATEDVNKISFLSMLLRVLCAVFLN